MSDDDWDDSVRASFNNPKAKFPSVENGFGGGSRKSYQHHASSSRQQHYNQNGVMMQKQVKCNNCGGIGHVFKACPSPRMRNGGASNYVEDDQQDRIKCHRCGQSGHISKQCFNRMNDSWESPTAWNGQSNGYGKSPWAKNSGYGHDKKPFRNADVCFKCGLHGHWANDCPINGNNDDDDHREKAPPEYIPPDILDETLFDGGISTGINFDKYAKEVELKVNGVDPPPPIDSFEDCGLRDLIRKNLKKAGYAKPTPVQRQALPIVKANRDMMACAQTGSGKTAAFLLPMINNLLEDSVEPHAGLPQTPEIIVVCPTRELAVQTTKEALKFASGSNLRSYAVYGGTSVMYQRDKLREQSINIVVATPGRLLQFIRDDTISLRQVRFFVLDEADRMLEMGFQQDIDAIVRHPLMPPKSSRQTLMFSATFPDEIQTAAKTYLRDDYLFLGVGLVGGACADVTQSFYEVQAFDKREKLLEILERSNKADKTIVFVEKKQQADFLASFLSQSEFKATSIHGDRHQSQREEAVRDFVKGRMSLLVATAVAARGLDIPNVAHVINYDLPKTIEEYVHRIGRTGRVGNTGKATSFFDSETDQALCRPLVTILEQAQQEVPAWLAEVARRAPGAPPSYGGSFGNFASSDIRTRNKTAPEAAEIIDEDDEWD